MYDNVVSLELVSKLSGGHQNYVENILHFQIILLG
jgi:hypothetical protein